MIQTNRCELKNLQSNDCELVKKLYTNIQVRRFLGGVVDLHSVNRKFLNMLESNTQSKYWVIRVKNNNNYNSSTFRKI